MTHKLLQLGQDVQNRRRAVGGSTTGSLVELSWVELCCVVFNQWPTMSMSVRLRSEKFGQSRWIWVDQAAAAARLSVSNIETACRQHTQQHASRYIDHFAQVRCKFAADCCQWNVFKNQSIFDGMIRTCGLLFSPCCTYIITSCCTVVTIHT